MKASKEGQLVRFVLRLGVALCTFSLPLAIVSTVVLGLFFDTSFYRAGQLRYRVATAAGLTQDQVNRIDDGIVRFFSGTESLGAAVVAAGGPIDVFNEREIFHMNDVRTVIRAVKSLQVASLVVIGVFALLAAITWSRGGRHALASSLIFGSIVTVLLGVAAGGLTFVGFDEVFITFHQVVFQNDFWQLDPRTDHLIQIFPFDFWFDAMVAVTLRVVLITVAVGGLGVALRRVDRAERRGG